MEVVEFGPLSDEQRSELEGDEADPFDAVGITLEFRAKERHVALRDDGRLVASAGLTSTQVSVGDRRFEVVGLGGVIIAAAWRGRGLARRVVEEALVRARASGLQFVMLFCHPDRAGLYERLGFMTITSPVRVKQAHGFAPMAQRTMWRPLEPGASWPAGDVTVHDLPF
ncbi:MAG: GNAT family N-acetyltransferase [Solirubrobacteraceae bacterium]